MSQTCHSGASIHRAQDFRTLQKVRTPFNSVARCGHGQSFGGRLPLSPSHAPKQAGNIRATCPGIVDRATANPSVRNRMIGKCVLNVFGGLGFLAEATNHLGVRFYVLDTKFGHRFDVMKPFVLPRIRQDVVAGKCVATMVSLP